MRAVQVVSLDGPQAVVVHDVPEPVPADGQVLVEVHAAGVCYPDVLLTRGQYQYTPELPFVPGAELAGVVRAAPEGSGLSEGDRVAAFPGFGAFAELATVSPELVFRLPDGYGLDAAAGVPMNYLTAHFALLRRGGLLEHDTVLVHGAAGGVGTAATQLAKAYGARVVAVVSSDAKGEVARAAGADDVVPADGFLAAVKDLTGGRGVDLVVDPVGGDRFTDSLRALAPEGRLLVVGFTGGDIPTVRVNRLLLGNTSVVGVGWGAYALTRTGFAQAQWAELLPHLESGAIDPPRGGTYRLEEAGTAIADVDERRATGKVVLTVR